MPNPPTIEIVRGVPLRLVDNGDGTYSVATVVVSGGAGPDAVWDLARNLPIKLPSLGDGTYAVAVSGASGATAGVVFASDHGEDIQAALDAMSDGQILQLTPGHIYSPVAELTTSKVNIEIRGGGGTGQYTAVGKGATQIVSPAGAWGLTYNPAAASTIFQGPVIRGVTFVDATGTALGGLRILRTNNWRVIDCGAAAFTTGIGFHSDGTGNLNQYPWLVNFGAYDCLTGVKFTQTGGCRTFGLTVDAHSNDPSGVLAGSTGVMIVSGATNHWHGSVIQGCAVGMDFQWVSANNVGNVVDGLRGEACTALIKCASVADSSFMGVQHNNAGLAGTTYGIRLDAACTENFVDIHSQAVTNTVDDLGTKNFILNNGQINYGSVVISNPAAGRMFVFNQLFTQNGIAVDQGGTTNGVLFGSALDTNLYRSAANKLATDDSFVCGGELFMGTAQDAKMYRIAANVIQTDGAVRSSEMGSAPANPTSNVEMQQYMKGDKWVMAFNKGGTMVYFTLDLTQVTDPAVWHFSTVAP